MRYPVFYGSMMFYYSENILGKSMDKIRRETTDEIEQLRKLMNDKVYRYEFFHTRFGCVKIFSVEVSTPLTMNDLEKTLGDYHESKND